ncbi:MAG: tetratricopeptide repeat protein [Elusimicrobiota bacterium]
MKAGRAGLLLPALIILCCLAAYFNSVGNGFVYDDKHIIVENPLIRKLSFAPYLFGTTYWGMDVNAPKAREGGLYRPLTMLSYSVNYRLGGLEPVGYHLANLVLHVFVSVMLFFLLRRLGLSDGASGLAALAFSALPVHTEAVSSVVGRAELLAAAFLLCSWRLAHLRAGAFRMGLSVVFFLLALLSKENAAVFPLVLALAEYASHPGSWKEVLKARAGVWALFLVALLLYLEWRYHITGAVFATGGEPYFSSQTTPVVFLTMSKFFARKYLWPMATGLGLSAEYPPGAFPDAGPGDAGAWACLLSIAAVAGAALWTLARAKSAKALSIMVFFAFLLPVLNVFFRIDVIGAERFLYLPSIGFCMLLGCRWEDLAAARSRAAVLYAFLAAFCLVWWTFKTVERNRDWRSDQSFWAAVEKSTGRSPRTLNSLGTVYDRTGNRVVARRYYTKALALDPDLANAMYNMGKSFFDEGDQKNAKSWFLKALDAGAGPDKDTLCFLGLIAQERRDYATAVRRFRQALEVNPYYPTARRNLGLLLFSLGNVEEGAGHLRQYLRFAPDEDESADVRKLLDRFEGRAAPSGAGGG